MCLNSSSLFYIPETLISIHHNQRNNAHQLLFSDFVSVGSVWNKITSQREQNKHTQYANPLADKKPGRGSPVSSCHGNGATNSYVGEGG